MNDYYVYAHRDKNGNTFYVGKGRDKRSDSDNRSDSWHRTVAENGAEFYVEIIAEQLTESDALFVESCIIKALSPNLSNLKVISGVIVPSHYSKEDKQVETNPIVYTEKWKQEVEEAVQRNKESIKQNKKEVMAEIEHLKERFAKYELTLEEREFLESAKATHTAKNLTNSELKFRKRIGKKLAKQREIEVKIKNLNIN